MLDNKTLANELITRYAGLPHPMRGMIQEAARRLLQMVPDHPVKAGASEVKSLRWLANMWPLVEKPEDDADKMSTCIHLYCTAAADRVEQMAEAIENLREKLKAYEDLEMTPEDIEQTMLRFSSFLMEMTGGHMSKTNYTVQAMVAEANDHFESVCDECADRQELAEIKAAKHPVKPGDYVYWILYDDEPYVSIGDKVGEVGTMGFFVGDNSFDGTTDTDNLIFFPFDVLGKNCFLSQEEAEAALAKDNNVPGKTATDTNVGSKEEE